MGLEITPGNNKVDVTKPIPPKVKVNSVQTNPVTTSESTVATKTNAKDLAFSGSVVKNRLTQQFNATGNNQSLAASQAIDSDKVENAVDNIKKRLSQSITDWDVSKGDLNNIQREFRNLNDSEAKAVFDGLSDGDLNRWASELDGLNGGFNQAEKKDLFNQLAGQLDAGNASRFMNALDGQENKQAFADSYANNAPDAQIVRIINGSIDKVPTNEDSAIIVAELIGGLDGNQASIDKVLGNMNQSQIDAVLESAVQKEIHTHSSLHGGGSVSVSHDPAPLAEILDVVRSSSNPEIKAKFFESAANQLSNIENSGGLFAPAVGKNEDATVVREALTRLLQSDTTGIMTELESNFRNGKGISSYAKSMLNAGETDELGQIVSRLSKGNDLSGNALRRFGTQENGTDGNPHYRNSQVLGYFAGGLFSGAKQITGDRSRQADMLTNVFGSIAGVAGTANVPAGVASSVLSGLTNEVVGQITDSLNRGTMGLEEAIESLLFPRNSNTGELYEGAAEADFDSAFSRVVLRNS